jgi:methyl-accepting chemotaxis protein
MERKMNINSMKTGVKLGAAFGILVLFFTLTGIFNLYRMSALGGLTVKMFNHPLTVSNAVRDIEINIISIHRSMKDVALSKDSAQIDAAVAKVNEYEQNVYKHFDIVAKWFLGDQKDVNAAKQLFTDWKVIRDEVVQLTRDGKVDEAAAITRGKGAKHVGKLQKKIDFLVDFADKKGKSFFANAQKTEKSTLILTAIILLGLIALAVILAIFITKLITTPLKKGVDLANSIAEGDLTSRYDVNSSDEFGEMGNAFNQSLEQLESIIQRATNAADENINSSDSIHSNSTDLATRTNQQAASITETSATMEQTAALVKQNSENSEEAKQVLEGFYQEIQEKMSLINNVTSTMQEIDDSGKQIDKIVNVINDISFQTNLLALNAAVEAARAGDAGRGFAVVASEVRNLAQKTAESSKTIQDIVTRNVASTRKGIELVNETSNFFTSNLQITSDILEKIRAIADSSNEQTTGIDQINETISQLEQVINQNAILSQELSGSAKQMISSAKELQGLLEQFKVNHH